ncbi:16S rRNA (guanine1207-N2)-methyltransferase [Hathewaya proteolytica DSM 3090]|uniref:16S rRNA (Guanine1207-N2)-methyltransferase n=1 Tax=Hathewaya proteolytica DSM 3090 TaxID=1121331 RepID=A0A1M6N7B2_9CLOT|nr:methyltransferase [Hathewaya proteolytica]SHJ91552.1 16S rRNA (guanine1207-N2)-methyltransferase [Hathewaya proteolytica DSM 3090]
MAHYFINDELLPHDYKEIRYGFKGNGLCFITDSGVFSKDHVDEGTDILINNLPLLDGKVLDLGCGYGCVGITLKKAYPNIDITMADVNKRAIELVEKNCQINNIENAQIIQSNCFDSIEGEFDYIILNPPIRAGKQVVFKMYEEAFSHLKNGGKFIFVMNKKHGLASSLEKIESLFGTYDYLYKKKGWNVIQAKRQ